MSNQTIQDRNKSCKDRIRENLTNRIKDLKQLWKNYLNDKEEDGNERLCEYGLSFDYVKPNTFAYQKEGYFRYQLSYGGPGDEFRFFTGPEYIPYRTEYWCLDWYDGAKIKLTGEKEKLMLEIFDWFKEGSSLSSFVFSK